MRQWRRSIPYLAEKAGKAARFTFNDVVGLALVAELNDTCGFQVRPFSDGIDSLFRRLTDLHPTNLAELFVIINFNETKLLKFEQTRKAISTRLAVSYV